MNPNTRNSVYWQMPPTKRPINQYVQYLDKWRKKLCLLGGKKTKYNLFSFAVVVWLRERACASLRTKKNNNKNSSNRYSIDLLIDEAHGTHSHCLFIFRTSGTCQVWISRRLNQLTHGRLRDRSDRCYFLVFHCYLQLAVYALLRPYQCSKNRSFPCKYLWIGAMRLLRPEYISIKVPLHDQMFKQGERNTKYAKKSTIWSNSRSQWIRVLPQNTR